MITLFQLQRSQTCQNWFQNVPFCLLAHLTFKKSQESLNVFIHHLLTTRFCQQKVINRGIRVFLEFAFSYFVVWDQKLCKQKQNSLYTVIKFSAKFSCFVYGQSRCFICFNINSLPSLLCNLKGKNPPHSGDQSQNFKDVSTMSTFICIKQIKQVSVRL